MNINSFEFPWLIIGVYIRLKSQKSKPTPLFIVFKFVMNNNFGSNFALMWQDWNLLNNCRLYELIDNSLGILAETFALPSLSIWGLKKKLWNRIIRILTATLANPKVDSPIFFLFLHFCFGYVKVYYIWICLKWNNK